MVSSPHDYTKCNLDAMIFIDQTSFGVGMCLCDDNDTFIQAHYVLFHGIPRQAVAEVIALHKSIEWIQSMNLSYVIFKTKCKIIKDYLSSSKK